MGELKVKNDGRILHIVSGDLGDANTSYSYINLGADNFNMLTLHFTITATTLTLEASNDSLSTENASKTWVDVTTALTGAVSATATGAWIIDMPTPFTMLRVKRLTTNATNALDLFLCRWQGG